MNTRLRFKLIALLITLSLAGLVAFQGYWLYGLYRTLYTQMEVNVKEAMKVADYKELALRLRQLNKEEDGKGFPERRLEIDYSHQDDANPIDSTLAEYQAAIKELENYIQQALHAKIDQSTPIEFHNFGRFLNEELEARSISTTYQLIVAYYPDSTGKMKGRMNLDRDTLRMQSPVLEEDFNEWKHGVRFDYPILSDQTLSYHLYLKRPAGVVLGQMSGILASSALLLVLIVLSFVYLLRTILKQKTVEELKADFTNNMTHELKTPLSVSYAAVDALLNFGEPVSPKQHKYLSIVKDQLTHLTGLVEQILTLTVENRSTFRLRPEAIALLPLATSLAEQYRLKTGRSVQFTLDIPESLEVVADPTHLYNILSNLIENAIKYCDKEPCLITLQAAKEAHGVSFRVTDNGRGIIEAHQRQIFDKFFRVPSGNLHNVKGYGLGLFYVKDMMARHGGSVGVSSRPGKGSTFTLYFPLQNLPV